MAGEVAMPQLGGLQDQFARSFETANGHPKEKEGKASGTASIELMKNLTQSR